MTSELTISQLEFVHKMMLALDDTPAEDLGRASARFAAYSEAGLLPFLRILPHDVYHRYDGNAAHLERTRRWVLTLQEVA
jgi:hypothetical protein